MSIEEKQSIRANGPSVDLKDPGKACELIPSLSPPLGGHLDATRSAGGASLSSLSEEQRSLLNTLKSEDGPQRSFISDDRDSLRLFIKEVMKHHVAPQVYRYFKAFSSPGTVVGDAIERLHGLYLRNAERNLRIFHGLSKVLRPLDQAGVPVLVLKGAHLAHDVYRNSSERVMGDVDLLFMKKDLSRAQKILIEAGYCPFAFPVDIHWQIDTSMTRRNVDMEALWKRSEEACISGVKTRVLAPEDLLVHLCVHLAFHHRFQLGAVRTFCDVREIIRHYDDRLEWEKVLGRAKEWGCEKVVYVTLCLAGEFLDVRVPAEVLASLRPADLRSDILHWAVEQIFHTRVVKDPLSPYFWKLLNRGSVREKVEALRTLVFTPPEFLSNKYSAPYRSFMNYLYYPIRMKENTLRYTRALWRIFVREKKMTAFAKRQRRSIAMMEWLSSG